MDNKNLKALYVQPILKPMSPLHWLLNFVVVVNVPAISRFIIMCLLDNLADSADCGGLIVILQPPSYILYSIVSIIVKTKITKTKMQSEHLSTEHLEIYVAFSLIQVFFSFMENGRQTKKK